MVTRLHLVGECQAVSSPAPLAEASLQLPPEGVSIYPPTCLQSACRADFIVAQGNALGSEVVVGCALKGHFNLL